MDPKVLNFIKEQRISCLTVIINNGQTHSAAMHYCMAEDPLTFYFLTEKGSRKMQSLPSKGSVAIGFNEETMITLQLEGEVEQTSRKQRKKAIEAFHNKFDNDVSKLNYSDVFLKFVPTWWRYTELKSSPKVIITS